MVALAETSWIRVWDPLVRFGHWALVIAFAVAYLIGEEEGETSELHEWAGYIVGGIVVWRVVWGLTGPQHARFSDFLTGPVESLRYLVNLMTGHTKRYVGHSPAGGAMVVALLLSIALTVVTGLFAEQGESKAALGHGRGGIVTQAFAEEERGAQAGLRGEEHESAIGEAHAVLANIALALIVFHILGVALASFVHRENLVRAMITGEKRAHEDADSGRA
jgi:cytochrome b